MHSQTCDVSSESILSVLLGNAINCCHKAIEVEGRSFLLTELNVEITRGNNMAGSRRIQNP